MYLALLYESLQLLFQRGRFGIVFRWHGENGRVDLAAAVGAGADHRVANEHDSGEKPRVLIKLKVPDRAARGKSNLNAPRSPLFFSLRWCCRNVPSLTSLVNVAKKPSKKFPLKLQTDTFPICRTINRRL